MMLETAILIASDLIKVLKPYCSRIEIAGSIRRKRAEVKDIEIVLARIPSMLYEFKTVIDRYASVKGDATGKYTQRLIKIDERGNRIYADIFMPLAEDYFRQLAIRTGPADFSHRVIAAGWNRKGWVGTDRGLRRESECERSGDKWICKAMDPTLPPLWNSEAEFFKWLGLKYLEPEERGMVAV